MGIKEKKFDNVEIELIIKFQGNYLWDNYLKRFNYQVKVNSVKYIVQDMSKYNSQLKKMPKKSSKRARRQSLAKLLRVPIGTSKVSIGSWKVPIGTSIVPIGTNLGIDPFTFCLG